MLNTDNLMFLIHHYKIFPMSDEFIPQNDLERRLIAAREGRISPQDFVRTLLDSEVLRTTPVRAADSSPSFPGSWRSWAWIMAYR